MMNNQQPQQLNIDPSTLPDLECEGCKGTEFSNVFSFKKISALISPNGKPGLVPIEKLMCVKCKKTINLQDL